MSQLRVNRHRCTAFLLALSMACATSAWAGPESQDSFGRALMEGRVGDLPAAAAAAVQPTASNMIESVRNTASDLVLSAMGFLGVRYKRGGNTEETGFDCSGFTRYVFESSVGRLLPRRSRDQAMLSDLISIPRDQLKPGDLVFFNTMRSAFSHVGIYLGEGKFIHAPRTGATIRVDDIDESYWTQRFNGARRVPDLAPGALKMQALVPPGSSLPAFRGLNDQPAMQR